MHSACADQLQRPRRRFVDGQSCLRASRRRLYCTTVIVHERVFCVALPSYMPIKTRPRMEKLSDDAQTQGDAIRALIAEADYVLVTGARTTASLLRTLPLTCFAQPVRAYRRQRGSITHRVRCFSASSPTWRSAATSACIRCGNQRSHTHTHKTRMPLILGRTVHWPQVHRPDAAVGVRGNRHLAPSTNARSADRYWRVPGTSRVR